MGKKLTLAERQRNEFEKELKKAIILIEQDVVPIHDSMALDLSKTEKRILRAYDIAEMRVTLYEAQHSE